MNEFAFMKYVASSENTIVPPKTPVRLLTKQTSRTQCRPDRVSSAISADHPCANMPNMDTDNTLHWSAIVYCAVRIVSCALWHGMRPQNGGVRWWVIQPVWQMSMCSTSMETRMRVCVTNCSNDVLRVYQKGVNFWENHRIEWIAFSAREARAWMSVDRSLDNRMNEISLIILCWWLSILWITI